MGKTWTGNWWVIALRAVAAILFAVAVLPAPTVDPRSIAVLFGAFALFDGTLAVVAAVRGPGREGVWRPMQAEGGVGVAVGVLALAWPGITWLEVVYLAVGWTLLTGALKILTASRLRSVMTGDWLLSLAGQLCVMLALVMTFFPQTSALRLESLLAGAALAGGLPLLVLAIRMRQWTRLNL